MLPVMSGLVGKDCPVCGEPLYWMEIPGEDKNGTECFTSKPEQHRVLPEVKEWPYMDLVIERQGKIVMVGHYRTQNGDLISDPVLVFAITASGDWFPIRIE